MVPRSFLSMLMREEEEGEEEEVQARRNVYTSKGSQTSAKLTNEDT